MANGHGGRRAGSGRKPGQRSKHAVELEERARQYGGDALKALASIMKDQEAPPAARVSAASVLLDRGFGKAKQPVEHSGELAVSHEDALAMLAADNVTNGATKPAKPGDNPTQH